MVKKVNRTSKKSNKVSAVPIGVKVIAIFAFVLSFLSVLTALALIFSAGVFVSSEDAQVLVAQIIEDVSASTTLSINMAETIPYIIGLGAVLSLAFAVLLYFVGKGLFNGKNWARVVMVILFGLGFIGALADILVGDVLFNLPDLIINGIVAGYLLFNKEVQKAFVK